MTTSPSDLFATSIRHLLRGSAALRAAAVARGLRPNASATAADAKAFGIAWAPTYFRLTGAEPDGVASLKLARSNSSAVIACAVTCALEPNPNHKTLARVALAI